jgi:hypothetical protein
MERSTVLSRFHLRLGGGALGAKIHLALDAAEVAVVGRPFTAPIDVAVVVRLTPVGRLGDQILPVLIQPGGGS